MFDPVRFRITLSRTVPRAYRPDFIRTLSQALLRLRCGRRV